MYYKKRKKDVVLAKFIKYMKKSLLHKKLNYLRDKEKLKKKVCSIDEMEESISVEENFNIEILDISKCLSDRELEILKLHIIDKYTYEEISKQFKVKPESIRKIKYRAIKKITEWKEKNNEN